MERRRRRRPSSGAPRRGRRPAISPLGHDYDQALAGVHKSPIAAPTTTITYGIAKEWGFIEAQLQMLEQNRKAKIISNPRITTVDNREARILVGQKIPLIVQDVAGNPLSQLQTIGIQLRVTPHLTADKKIVMDLHPEVSDLSTQSTVQGGVIINTSEADTRVMVDDGQTAVIGGLIRTNEGQVRTGVPYLKDIPLLGMLFRSNTTAQSNRELLIFVTPRIINARRQQRVDGTGPQAAAGLDRRPPGIPGPGPGPGGVALPCRAMRLGCRP